MVRDSAILGTLPAGTNLETLRKKGAVRFVGWGSSAMALPRPPTRARTRRTRPSATTRSRRSRIPTLNRRAQFYIDHDWFLEAGEEMPVHKDNPQQGGEYPLRLTSGHPRWSIHSDEHRPTA